jgi:hypothetical protein
MDYKKQLEFLRDKVNEKQSAYLKAEDEMVIETKYSQNGFIDMGTIDKFNITKLEWQLAVNDHNNFLIMGLKEGWFK